MKRPLVDLAYRKTQQSRQAALDRIEEWRHAIDLVPQVNAMAEWHTALPDSLTATVAKAAEEARVANHIEAIAIAQNATAGRAEIRNVVKKDLLERIRVLSEELERVARERNVLAANRAAKLRSAEGIKSEASKGAQNALRIAEATQVDEDTSKGCLPMGCALHFVIVVAAFNIWPMFFSKVSTHEDRMILVVGSLLICVWILGGWWLINRAIAFVRRDLRKMRHDSKLSAKRIALGAAEHEAERDFENAKNLIDQEHVPQQDELDSAQKMAEVGKAKAEEALRFLEANCHVTRFKS